MAVTVELKLDTDALREQIRQIAAELREELKCPCSKRVPFIDETHIHHAGAFTIDDVFAAHDRLWSNR